MLQLTMTMVICRHRKRS